MSTHSHFIPWVRKSHRWNSSRYCCTAGMFLLYAGDFPWISRHKLLQVADYIHTFPLEVCIIDNGTFHRYSDIKSRHVFFWQVAHVWTRRPMKLVDFTYFACRYFILAEFSLYFFCKHHGLPFTAKGLPDFLFFSSFLSQIGSTPGLRNLYVSRWVVHNQVFDFVYPNTSHPFIHFSMPRVQFCMRSECHRRNVSLQISNLGFECCPEPLLRD